MNTQTIPHNENMNINILNLCDDLLLVISDLVCSRYNKDGCKYYDCEVCYPSYHDMSRPRNMFNPCLGRYIEGEGHLYYDKAEYINNHGIVPILDMDGPVDFTKLRVYANNLMNHYYKIIFYDDGDYPLCWPCKAEDRPQNIFRRHLDEMVSLKWPRQHKDHPIRQKLESVEDCNKSKEYNMDRHLAQKIIKKHYEDYKVRARDCLCGRNFIKHKDTRVIYDEDDENEEEVFCVRCVVCAQYMDEGEGEPPHNGPDWECKGASRYHRYLLSLNMNDIRNAITRERTTTQMVEHCLYELEYESESDDDDWDPDYARE